MVIISNKEGEEEEGEERVVGRRARRVAAQCARTEGNGANEKHLHCGGASLRDGSWNE